MKFVEIFSIFKRKPVKDRGRILYNDDNFGISLNGFDEYFDWCTIEKLTAYKVDLLATDCVCLYIELNNGRRFEINEELPGWDGFVAAMNKALQLNEGWFGKIVQPAFETNETVIYINSDVHI